MIQAKVTINGLIRVTVTSGNEIDDILVTSVSHDMTVQQVSSFISKLHLCWSDAQNMSA